jgi:hypothetical protein
MPIEMGVRAVLSSFALSTEKSREDVAPIHELTSKTRGVGGEYMGAQP